MDNIKLVHHNDGKKKSQSHEVYLKQFDNFFYIPEVDISSYDLFDIIGYGKDKEEALYDLFKKLTYLFNEYNELKKLLFETDTLTNNIVEVDSFGKEIVKQP